jgi:putative peptidoglycan lipid II flippase
MKAAQNHQGYSAMLDWGLRLCLLLAVPATVALAVLAQPIIATLFMSGKFHAHDVLMTAQSLVAYSVGLIAIIAIKILAPAYYARQDIKTPVKIGVVTLVITQLLNVIFIGPLAHAGLALALSCGACFNVGMLYSGLRRTGVYQPAPGWVAFLVKLVVAVVLMALVLWYGSNLAGDFLHFSKLDSILRLGILVLAGGVVYFATLWICGFRARDFSRNAV